MAIDIMFTCLDFSGDCDFLGVFSFPLLDPVDFSTDAFSLARLDTVDFSDRALPLPLLD